MARILIMSNSSGKRGGNRYGYSIVSSEVLYALQKSGHQCFMLGMQSIHPAYMEEDTGVVFLGLKNDAFCSDILETYINQYKIDVLITFWDVWLDYANYLPECVKRTKVKWICHLTLNSSPMSPFFKVVPYADLIVAPSKFVYNEVINFGMKNVVYIPHGVDLNVFKPENKTKDERFLYLTVMRNKGYQKNFPALFEAYKTMLETRPETKEKTTLLVVSDPIETEGVNLFHFRNFFKLENNVIFITWKPTEDLKSIEACFEGEGSYLFANNNLNDVEMNKIYNLSNCLVSSSSGESFNLPVLECQACGIPVICANNTTSPELVGEPKSGIMADCKFSQRTPMLSSINHVDVDSLAEAMYSMFQNRDKEQYIVWKNNAINNAVKYDWKLITPNWIKAVEEVLKVKETNYEKGELGL